MKTIFIVIGGLADIPDPEHDGQTPLMAASTPSLDALAKCGCCGAILPLGNEVPVTPENAILSLLGYDFSRGIVPLSTLSKFGAGMSFPQNNLRLFVVPKFSGHGVVVSDIDSVRGAAMMAMLKPLFPMGEGIDISEGNPTGSLADKAMLAIKAIDFFDFVLIYVDGPDRAAMQGDVMAKIEAIEAIDKDLITPVADFVWNAKLQMNLVVTGDLISSWKTRDRRHGDVPAVVYFNDDLPYDMDRFDEITAKDGPLNAPLPGDLIRLLVSFEPYDDNKEQKNNPPLL